MREPIVPEPDNRPRPPPDAPGGGSGHLPLLLALAAIGLAIFSTWHGYGRSVGLERRLEHAEAQLAGTGDSQISSLAELQRRLDEHDKRIDFNLSEIRKLWVVAYDTNRKSIADNEAALEALQQQLQDGERRLQEEMASLRTLADSLGGKQSQIEELLEQWQALSTRYQQALEQLASIDGRVGGIEKDIDAINAFRRDTNRRLTELQDQGADAP